MSIRPDVGDAVAERRQALIRLRETLSGHGVPHLITRRSGTIAALVQAPHDDIHAQLSQLLESLPSLVVGVGRPASAVEDVVESARDAGIAVQRFDASASRRILEFEDFDLVTLLISDARRERIQPKVDEVMDVLRANPGLHEALAVYFAHDLDVMSAARAMHLHHNTLRYRLGRIEAELDRPLKDPATIALLYIALAAERIARPDGGAP